MKVNIDTIIVHYHLITRGYERNQIMIYNTIISSMVVKSCHKALSINFEINLFWKLLLNGSHFLKQKNISLIIITNLQS